MGRLLFEGLNDYVFVPGKILLEDQRYVLMGADALGTLKRDLTFALGLERTKGFMLRYGWHYGSDYAKKLKNMYPHTTKKEWFHLGPKIHSQTGSVYVTPSQIIYDEQKDFYYAEGYWTDSYEAEQHLKYFGVSDVPVCFIAAGHAGGYISELLGRTALCKEFECQGKGDPYCRWVIKPLEDWDEQVRQEMIYYEETNLDLELDRAYKRIESQKMSLQKTLHVNEQLSKSLVEDNSLATLVRILGENFNLGVVMEDRKFYILESYGIHDGYALTDAAKEKIRSEQTLTQAERAKCTHLSFIESPYPHERLIAPILIKNKVFGYLSFIKENGKFSEAELLSLERTAAICSIKLLNDMTSLEAERRMMNHFIDELLREDAQERNLNYRLNLMGYNLLEPHYVLLADIKFTEREINQDMEEYKMNTEKQLMEVIHQFLQKYDTKGIVSIKRNQIIVLLPLRCLQQAQIKLQAWCASLVEEIERKHQKNGVTIGVSALCRKISDYKRGYDEAGKAIQIAKLAHEKNKIVSFEELGLFSRIFGSDNAGDLKALAVQRLSGIKNYDEKYKTELLPTLYRFLENQGSIQKTSRAMNASIGSIRYRLKRIKEISNIDVHHSKDFFEAHLALQVFIFMGYMEI